MLVDNRALFPLKLFDLQPRKTAWASGKKCSKYKWRNCNGPKNEDSFLTPSRINASGASRKVLGRKKVGQFFSWDYDGLRHRTRNIFFFCAEDGGMRKLREFGIKIKISRDYKNSWRCFIHASRCVVVESFYSVFFTLFSIFNLCLFSV